MTQFNSKINLYQAQPYFKASPSSVPFLPGMQYTESQPQAQVLEQPANQLPAVQLPDMYYQPNDKKVGLVDTIKKYDFMDLITPWFEHPLLMIGTCFGISKGVDAFSKSCNKEYEKSALGKAARFGDRIAQSKLFQNKPVQACEGFLGKCWKKISDLGMKNSIIKAMVETPTRPENAMPKSEVLNTEQRILEQFNTMLKDTGMLSDGGKYKTPNIKLDKETLEALEKDFGKKLSEVSREKYTNRYLLKQIGVSESEITKIIEGPNASKATMEKILKHIGVGSEAELKAIAEGSNPESIKEAVRICEKLKNIKINKGKLVSNETGFQELFNRFYSIREGAKTKAGRFTAKLTQWLHRGLTFGGTKATVMLWVAPLIARTLVNTHKAEKNEKVGTFVDGMIMATSWVFTFPLILKAIHAFGGAQYAGMGKEKVEELRKLINDFNTEVRNGKFKSFKEWRNAVYGKNGIKKQIKNLYKVENQGFITQTIRKISKFTKSDLMKLERYEGKNILGNFVRNTPAKIKNFAWSAGRFGVFMFIGMPFVDKIINKVAGAIFGNHYDGMAEKENQEAKEKQEEFTKKDLEERLYNAQAVKMGVIPNPEEKTVQQEVQPIPVISEQPQEQPIKQPETQTVSQSQEQVIEEQSQAQPVIQRQEQVLQTQKRDNYTYIPSQENLIKKSVQPVINKYIPSQNAANLVKTFDNSGLDSALRKADRAEQKAMQILAGKFPN